MRIFEIKKLMVVTAVACFPIACGSSVTGPDTATLAGTESTVAALRMEPLPPIAPEAPSPNTVPEPVIIKGDPGVDDVPSPGVVPDNRNSRRPAPQPDLGTVPAPSGGPATPVGVPPVDPGPVPQPVCIAASFDIASAVLFMGNPRRFDVIAKTAATAAA